MLFCMGISLGAGILANYMATEGEKCKLAAGFSVGSHFDTTIAMDFLGKTLFGLYDYGLGIGNRFAADSIYN